MRIARMRRGLIGLLVAAVVALGVASAAGGDRTARPVTLPAGLSVSVPMGWHVLRGWLSDVPDPAPRLAVASFPARLSRRTCACGFPNVIEFPRDGAFIFVWEYLNPSRLGLARAPRRPSAFQVEHGGVHLTCDGPTDTVVFKDSGRVFQVEVYLGPRATPALRSSVAATLDSLHVGRAT